MKTDALQNLKRWTLSGALHCVCLSSMLLWGAMGCDGDLSSANQDSPPQNSKPGADLATLTPDMDVSGGKDMPGGGGGDSPDMQSAQGCGVDAIYKGLEPTCANCHRSGKTPYFSSSTAFYNLLISNPTWVAPGDPDRSELVALLEGRGSGQYKQMPPGLEGFGELEAQGQTGTTVAKVRTFVEELKGCQATLPPAPERVQVQRKSAAQIHRTLKQHLGLEDGDVQPYNSRVSDRRYPIWNPDDVERVVGGVNVNPFATSAARRWHALGGESYLTNIAGNRSFSPSFGQTMTQVAQAWCRIAVEKPNNTALFREVDASNLETSTPEQIDANLRYLMLRFWGHAATDEDVAALRADIYDVYAARSDVSTAWVAVCATLIRDPLWTVY